MISNYFDVSEGRECSERRVKEAEAPIIKKKCKKCPAIISYRKGMPPIKECADCRDGPPKFVITDDDLDPKYRDKKRIKTDANDGPPMTNCRKCGAEFPQKPRQRLCDNCGRKGWVKNTIENKCIDCGVGVGSMSRKKKRCDDCGHKNILKTARENNKKKRLTMAKSVV